MKRSLGPLVAMALVALCAHWLTITLVPAFIMDRAMAALEARGVALHRFTTPERVTPRTQQVVRSSPDLYYALCRYDLRPPDGMRNVVTGVTVTMGPWDDYQSLSFFDARTNNFATIRGTGKGIKVHLERGKGSGYAKPDLPTDGRLGGIDLMVESPTDTGVILIRRLAPSAAAFSEAQAAGPGDTCFYGAEPAIVY